MKFLFFLIFSFHFSLLSSQTYIGPKFGLDFMQIESTNPNFFIDNRSFTNISPLIGFNIEQKLIKSFYLTYQFFYTYKVISAGLHALIPITSVKFSYIANRVSINSYVNKKIHLGLGISFDNLENVKNYYDNELRPGNIEIISEKGIVFSIGKKYKNFNVEILLNYGLTSYNNEYVHFIFDIKPINSIGLTLSYDIKVGDSLNFEKKKSKK